MKNLLKLLLIVLLVVGIGVWYFLSYRLDATIEGVVESAGSTALGTSVQVGKITTNLREGSLKIDSLTVANPPGYEAATAISFNGIEAAVDYDGFVIDRIVIDQPTVNIEERNGGSNFSDMMAGMESSEEETPEEEGAEETAEGEETIITIRQFRMNESQASFVSESLGSDTQLKVKAIELDNISGTPSEVAEAIAGEIIGEVTKVAAAEILKAEARKQLGIEQPEESESVGDKLKGLFGGDKDDS